MVQKLLQIFTLLSVVGGGVPVSAYSFKNSCINIYNEPGRYGDHFFLDAVNRGPLPKRLNILVQNFENLGTFIKIFRERLLVGGQVKEFRHEVPEVKSENQLQRLAMRIKKQDPDIIVGVEVKDLATAQEYAKNYLDDKYQAILIEGNDERGIDVCYFLKRTLALDLEVKSFKKYSSDPTQQSPTFSRDFPVLLLRDVGAPKNSTPNLAIFATHYKSRRGNTEDLDESLNKRTKQVKASLKIIEELKKQYPKLPIFVGGDFNNDIRSAPEFRPFFVGGFRDAMDFVQEIVPIDQRYTQYFFRFVSKDSNGKQLKLEQLDAALINSALSDFILAAGIQRDVDTLGKPVSLPQTPDAVNERGSDHDGVYTWINYEALVNSLRENRLPIE